MKNKRLSIRLIFFSLILIINHKKREKKTENKKYWYSYKHTPAHTLIIIIKKFIFDVQRIGGKKKVERYGLHPTQRTVLLNQNNQNIYILQNTRHAITKDILTLIKNMKISIIKR